MVLVVVAVVVVLAFVCDGGRSDDVDIGYGSYVGGSDGSGYGGGGGDERSIFSS